MKKTCFSFNISINSHKPLVHYHLYILNFILPSKRPLIILLLLINNTTTNNINNTTNTNTILQKIIIT